MKINRNLRKKTIALAVSAAIGTLLVTGTSYAQESLNNADSSPVISYEIESGDSLGWLAEQLREFGGTYHQRRKFIVESSPNIFVDGNQNSLQGGSTLSLDMRKASFYQGAAGAGSKETAPQAQVTATNTQSKPAEPEQPVKPSPAPVVPAGKLGDSPLINYQIESGDSLGWLAEQLRSFGGSYHQRRKFIVESAPNIFVNGNQNSLQGGSTLNLDMRKAGFYVAPAPVAAVVPETPKAAPEQASDHADDQHKDDHASHKVALPPGVRYSPYDASIFSPDPSYAEEVYNAEAQKKIYGGKRAVITPRPLLELGRPQYQAGPLKRDGDIALNEYNRATTALHVYGDLRTGVAMNHDGKNDRDLIATRLNLDIDLKLTGTERIHAFVRPLDKNGRFSRIEFQDDGDSELLVDGNLETLFFEGDLGAIVSTLADKQSPFDLPFAVGLMPLLFQNGLWLEDAFTGAAFTIPARNSRTLDISNFDITFFAGFDKVSSPGIRDEFGQIADDDVHVYGMATFWELLGGYAEMDYAFIDGQDQFDDLDHHNFSMSFSKRYKDVFSTSFRYLTTFGQDPVNRDKTADGTLLVWENSLITSRPSTFIPYANFFAAFDRPQSVARDNGGILKTVGINFESDALTGYPLLDDTGQDVWGGAIGVENLFSLDQQLVIELATVQLMDDDAPLGKAIGDQYALGVRYQKPLSRAWIFRADAIKGWLEDDENFSGVRVEFRRKW